ncbi:aminotransferase class I/II-fold pyridoxal phosphate-dependent enzyme [Bacteriovorax stolpii]|uniref:Aminotransferase n=1 Tax=Bacteriovorax stolpii TaxID=960 RepID=A0A2K9NVP6_BACTC|nr:methionine aminotransferase [Bacteriovorax stolpii]AUN99570.1 aminotransferase [Bacteriovorax stolpii]QDK40434.1 aminotransferase class I/II-fold pyridoxal phosphate-dependent enzyme [Bacteriovorax stolpii]TDP51199.1 aspartate/methionine/tyrosine aminotransferase [Bacteriovorax stolpii]
MKPLNNTVEQFTESIFSTMTKMAMENKAINLSQGFPDFDGPSWVSDLAVKALKEAKNQYAPSMGVLSLREAIAHNYARFYNYQVNPLSEVVVTNGATEAIFCACLALLNPGDEVVVLEPFYDSYLASIKLSGAKAIPVTLKAPDFHFDIEELKAAISDKTKLLIVNNPHNPTGKVFTAEEIKIIGDLAKKHDFYLLSDEVYEFLTFDVAHKPTATYEDLKERTITISSTGKTFGLTGWKIGWAIGPAALIKAIHNVHQFSTFCVAHPLQVAMAEALMKMDEYLVDFRADYKKKKELLVTGLKELGFNVLSPKGTYFAMALLPEGENDIDYCKKLIVEKKVATIPTSAFYIKSDEGSRMIRFCFAKKDETLLGALENLKH